MKFELQEHIGKYPVIREIGSGATSRVYLARDTFAERDVAIKVFLFDSNIDPQTSRMMHKAFLAEASLAGKLNHPHIVDIFDAVAEPDHSYLVMEYVPGTTLEAHSDVTSLLPLNKVVEIIFKCIRALDYAYQMGVIHRDIKPGNILYSDKGDIKVSDFGASYLVDVASETTQMAGVGSPAYMSPEAIRMEKLTHQTDIYSLGVVMYKLLTGKLPFNASNQLSLTYEILNMPPMPPSSVRPDLPKLLDDICLKAMQKNPADRYQTWIEFGKDLSAAFGSLRLSGETLSDSEKFNELRQLPFFADFDDVMLWEGLRIGSWRNIPRGTVIIKEGDPGDSFFLLVQGEVEVHMGGKLLNVLERGSIFGELLYFVDKPSQRSTTIRALTDVTALEIKAAALRNASAICQVSFQRAFMRVLIDRLSQANAKLAGRC